MEDHDLFSGSHTNERLETEITLQVDGEDIPVKLEQPGPLQLITLAETAPSVEAIELKGSPAVPGMVDHVRALVEEVSDFPVELLDELPMEQFKQLIQSVAAVSEGKEPTVDNLHPDHASNTFDDLGDSPFDEFDDSLGNAGFF